METLAVAAVIVVVAVLLSRFFLSAPRRPAPAPPPAREDPVVSPLGAAVSNGDAEAVRALLAEGADPNAAAVNDDPALFVAVASRHSSLVTSLVSAGAAPEHCHRQVGSCLALAIMQRDRSVFETLVRAGVPVGLCNEGGAQELHVAALLGERGMVERLIELGADIHATNFQGGTPLRSAADRGHVEIVRLLLDAGADPSPVDAFHKRPIDYAKENGHGEVAALLRAADRPATATKTRTANPLSLMLPPRGDATLQSVIEARRRKLTLMNAGASALEAPTMIAAVRAVLGASFQVSFDVDGEPDPRLPVRDVETVLWKYDGTEAHPAVPRPATAVQEAVGRVAAYPYLLRVWSDLAREAAAGSSLPDVLAVMVYPPPAPSYLDPWDWWFRVQVAAALVASHIGSEPWTESPRRKALEDIADGPADWSNTAAILALYDVARRDPSTRPAVIETLLGVTRRAPNPPAYQHAMQPAALALLELGEVSKEITELVNGEAGDGEN